MGALTTLVGGEAKFKKLTQLPEGYIKIPSGENSGKSLEGQIKAIDPTYLTTHSITVTTTPDGRRVFLVNARVNKGTPTYCPNRRASDKMVVAFVENFNYWDLPNVKKYSLESLKHVFGFKRIDTRCSFDVTQDTDTWSRTVTCGQAAFEIVPQILQNHLDCTPHTYKYTCLISGSLSSETANLLVNQYQDF